MQDEQQFTIEGRLPSLNEYTRACRAHWSRGAKLKQQVEAEIMWQITQARLAGKLAPVTVPVVISLEWHEKNRRRDFDNVTFGVKFILDALQRMVYNTGAGNTHIQHTFRLANAMESTCHKGVILHRIGKYH